FARREKRELIHHLQSAIPAPFSTPRSPRATHAIHFWHSTCSPGANQVSYRDLREFITEVEALGALRRIDGADPRFEIGGITEVAPGLPDCPALLFDSIQGFARGFRVVTNATTSATRAALALNIHPPLSPLAPL